MIEFVESVSGGVLWGVGFGAAMGVLRTAGTSLKPLARGTVKGALVLNRWVRTTAAESYETFEDLYQEAKSESRDRR